MSKDTIWQGLKSPMECAKKSDWSGYGSTFGPFLFWGVSRFKHAVCGVPKLLLDIDRVRQSKRNFSSKNTRDRVRGLAPFIRIVFRKSDPTES